MHNRIYKGLSQWLQDRLVPQTIIDKLLGASSSDAYTLTIDDLDAIGERFAWYEEWLLARCPDYVQAEKGAKELIAEGHEPGKKYDDALQCEDDALAPEISAGLWEIRKRQFQADIKKYPEPKK